LPRRVGRGGFCRAGGRTGGCAMTKAPPPIECEPLPPVLPSATSALPSSTTLADSASSCPDVGRAADVRRLLDRVEIVLQRGAPKPGCVVGLFMVDSGPAEPQPENPSTRTPNPE